MAQKLILKWGNIKGWEGFTDGSPARNALENWGHTGPGFGAMERTTPEHREAICAVIDAVDGEIWNDWDGEVMSKDEAKAYVRNYGAR